MADTATAIIGTPAWVDLATTIRGGPRVLRGVVRLGHPGQPGSPVRWLRHREDRRSGRGRDRRTQSPDQPAAWSVYIGSDDLEALAQTAAGGAVVAPPFDVGDQGRMAVFTDASGAFISAWQGTQMGGFQTTGAERLRLGRAERPRVVAPCRSTRGLRLDGEGRRVARAAVHRVPGRRPQHRGATEMSPMVPAEVPNYWLVYFAVDDVDAIHRRAVDTGGGELVAPLDFPGGRMSIVRDPQGAAFGLMRLAAG